MVALLLAAALAATTTTDRAVGALDAPIRLVLSSAARYTAGDPGRVEVRAGEDGYLFVLQADAYGAVRVLFPIDPADDAFVEGGATYQLRDRAGRAGVLRTVNAGRGVVVAALSRQPLELQALMRNGRWDAAALRLDERNDLEDALIGLAERAAGREMDYDVASFSVFGEDDDPRLARGRYGYPGGGLGYGYGGYGFGGNGFGNPFFYDPFFGWGYGYGFGGGRFGYGGFYGGGFGGGFGRGPIFVVPSGPRSTGYEVKGRGRSWSGSNAAPAARRDGGGRASGSASGRATGGGSGRVSGSVGSSGSKGSSGASAKGGGRSWGGRPR